MGGRAKSRVSGDTERLTGRYSISDAYKRRVGEDVHVFSEQAVVLEDGNLIHFSRGTGQEGRGKGWSTTCKRLQMCAVIALEQQEALEYNVQGRAATYSKAAGRRICKSRTNANTLAKHEVQEMQK